jgi:hypothetical protein
VHAAGVRADSTVLNLSEETLWTALRPKLLGAWNLHAATRDRALDWFVLFSSIAASLGSPGQAAYAAGNEFLDALARARVARGAPALSVQWGPFSGVGMAAALDPTGSGRRMAARGLESFAPEEGISLLGRLLHDPRATVGLFRLSLRRWLESTPQAAGMRYIEELPRESVTAATPDSDALRELLMGRSTGDRAAALERHITGLLAVVLQLAPTQIDRRAPFASLGLDSLTGLELRNRIQRSVGAQLQPTLLYT